MNCHTKGLVCDFSGIDLSHNFDIKLKQIKNYLIDEIEILGLAQNKITFTILNSITRLLDFDKFTNLKLLDYPIIHWMLDVLKLYFNG